jgi:SAM-dependent methyltransferase
MIDRWAPPDEEDSYYTSGSEIARHGEHIFNEAFQEAWEETRKFWERAVMHKEESSVAAMHFPVAYFDFVFIDSDHSYAGVKKAIAEWMGKVKPGGFIGFHDYGHPDQGEVKKAVDEAFPHVETDENHTAFVRIS